MATKKLQILGNLGAKVYVQNEEPIDAPDGSIWIDLDEELGSYGGFKFTEDYIGDLMDTKLGVIEDGTY